MKTAYKAVVAAIVSLLFLSAPCQAAAEDELEVTFEGLVPVEGARAAMAYVDPNADFSVFQQVAILDPFVAFRANWQRDQRRRRSRNVRASDMERIKADTAAIFRDVFIERLEAAGFAITTEAGDDVLVLRPAIIDLDVTAADVSRPGRSRTYTANSGAATLYIQLVDSMTGDLLGRAADRRVARDAGGFMTWNNRVTNMAGARRTFGRWADQLIEFLKTHYQVEGEK